MNLKVLALAGAVVAFAQSPLFAQGVRWEDGPALKNSVTQLLTKVERKRDEICPNDKDPRECRDDWNAIRDLLILVKNEIGDQLLVDSSSPKIHKNLDKAFKINAKYQK